MDNTKLTILNTYFKNLLFNHSSKTEKSIKLLILGSDEYARTAFKQAFSCGQIPSRNLHIAIASFPKKNECSLKSTLLEEMPALHEFARITETWCSDSEFPDKYADIAFSENENLTPENIKLLLKQFNPNYVICSLGNDETNRRTAEFIADTKKIRFTGYICRQKKNCSEYKNIEPVFPVTSWSDIHPDLQRMAYNSHYVYAKSENERITSKNIHEEFYDIKYNNDSSFAFALHVKYKLAVLNISMDDIYKASDRFMECLEKNGKTLINELAYYEHRRWCAYTIAEGFQPPPDNDISYIPEECNYKKKFTVNGKEIKYHPALAVSENSDVLPENFDWEKGSLSDLDPLDKMSVKIHRELARNIYRNDDSIRTFREAVRKMDSLVSTHELFVAFDKNIELILAGNRNVATIFSTLCDNFINALSEIYPPQLSAKLNTVSEYVSLLKKAMFIRVEYLKRCDYKALDFDMINSIPMILKYNENLVLVQKLRSPYSNSKLNSVKNAFDLDPKAVIFTDFIDCSMLFDAPSPLVQIEEDIEYFGTILKYRRERNFADEISLRFVIQGIEKKKFTEKYGDCNEYIRKKCQEKNLSSEDIEAFHTDKKNSWNAVMKHITGKYSKSRKSNYTIVNGLPEDSTACHILEENGAYPLESFRCCFIPKNFTVEEHMKLHKARITSFDTKPLADCYKKLWGICHDKSLYNSNKPPEDIWNTEIPNLSHYINTGDSVHVGYVPKVSLCENISTASITVSNDIASRLSEIFRILQDSYIVGNVTYGYGQSATGEYRSDFTTIKYCFSSGTFNLPCESNDKINNSVTIEDSINYIVENVKKLTFTSASRFICKKKPDSIEIRLSKCTFNLDENIISENLKTIVNKLVGFGLLIKKSDSINKQNKHKITEYSLAFSELKDVFTTSGTILEIFIYFAMKNSAYFTDVISNMKISWLHDSTFTQNGTVNEIDVAATKVSDTMLISAKLRNDVDEKVIYEIKTLCTQFNAIPVVISGIPNAVKNVVEIGRAHV